MKGDEHIISHSDQQLKKKDQCNDEIDYDPKFDNEFCLYSVPPMYTLTLVTVSLRGGKKNRAKVISRLTCLWDIRYTKITINSKHTGPYEPRMRSNKVE